MAYLSTFKLNLSLVDDFVRTAKSESTLVLDAANSFHTNLQFALEKTSPDGKLGQI